MNLYDTLLAKALSGSGGGGGGGDANIVEGSFKFTVEEDGPKTIDLPYTGNGYPIRFVIYIKNGVKSDPVFSPLIQRFATAWFGGEKVDISTAPSYGDGTTKNCSMVISMHKNSSSVADDYAASFTGSVSTYRSSGASGSAYEKVRFKDSKTLSVYMSKTNQVHGFVSDVEYAYRIEYSE